MSNFEVPEPISNSPYDEPKEQERFLILEPKGYDPLKDVKRAAAERWCAAVNAHGGFGHWQYRMIKRAEETIAVLNGVTA